MSTLMKGPAILLTTAILASALGACKKDEPVGTVPADPMTVPGSTSGSTGTAGDTASGTTPASGDTTGAGTGAAGTSGTSTDTTGAVGTGAGTSTTGEASTGASGSSGKRNGSEPGR